MKHKAKRITTVIKLLHNLIRKWSEGRLDWAPFSCMAGWRGDSTNLGMRKINARTRKHKTKKCAKKYKCRDNIKQYVPIKTTRR